MSTCTIRYRGTYTHTHTGKSIKYFDLTGKIQCVHTIVAIHINLYEVNIIRLNSKHLICISQIPFSWHHYLAAAALLPQQMIEIAKVCIHRKYNRIIVPKAHLSYTAAQFLISLSSFLDVICIFGANNII